MSMWYQFLGIVFAGFFAWLLYSQVKSNPEAFSTANFSKSAYTLGILALVLIAFIAFCIMILRA